MPSRQSEEQPLAIDLYAGLGGWSEGLLAEGFRVVGFDIEQHVYGEHRYPGQLVIQDVLTLHGSQFKSAALIVASPPCQFFSYTAMPWSRAKALAAKVRADPTLLEKELALFRACFRIQKEASEAAGHHVPLIVENVRGAQEWVGRARWSFGSFYLWGDVPALMPITVSGVKVGGFSWSDFGKPGYQAQAFNGQAEKRFAGRRTDVGKGARFTSRDCGLEKSAIVVGDLLDRADEGRKGYAKVLGQSEISRKYGSKSPQRQMAAAMIAKIPTVLSRHIASTFMPK